MRILSMSAAESFIQLNRGISVGYCGSTFRRPHGSMERAVLAHCVSIRLAAP
jgi:hypothetical protein